MLTLIDNITIVLVRGRHLCHQHLHEQEEH